MDGEWTRDGLGMDWRWTGQGVEGLEVDSTRTPWTRGGLHRDSTRISGGVINTVSDLTQDSITRLVVENTGVCNWSEVGRRTMEIDWMCTI